MCGEIILVCLAFGGLLRSEYAMNDRCELKFTLNVFFSSYKLVSVFVTSTVCVSVEVKTRDLNHIIPITYLEHFYFQ